MSNVTGEIIALFPVQQVSEKFKKAEVVVKTNDQYPQEIIIQFAQDKTEKLNGFKVGDNVEVGINLRGRGYQKKDGTTGYFNTIEGWKISKADGSAPASTGSYTTTQDEPDDLPF
jgi:hypothetical protein